MTKPSLKDLLAEGARMQAREKELKELQRKQREQERFARQGKIVGGDAASIAAAAAAIENELRWRSIALVTLFTQQSCTGCGAVATTVAGIMVKQEHMLDATAKRMVRVVGEHPELPHTHEVFAETVRCCYECYDDNAPLALVLPMRRPE